MPSATYDHTGGQESHDVAGAQEVRLELLGAGGESGDDGGGFNGGAGGTGGYVEVNVAVSETGSLDLWVGGGDETMWGRSNGGAGAGGSGGGGGSTEIRIDGSLVAAADAGGGGSSFAGDTRGGAGGGARGGSGGGGGGSDPTGESAEGSGFGGDGGDASGASPEDGGDGGQEIGTALETSNETTTVGGGNDDNGQIIIEATVINEPSNLAVDAERETEIDVSFDAAAGVDEYRLYRHTGQDPYADGEQVATIAEDGSTSYSHTDTDLTNGQQYRYQVVAVFNGGESDPTAEATGTTLPPSPTVDTDPFDDRIELAYGLADNNPDGHVDILRSTDGSMGDEIATESDLSVTEFVDDTVTTDETYHYTLRRDTGDVTAFSSQAEETATFRPVLNPTIDEVDTQSIDLSWESESSWSGDTEVWRDRADYDYDDEKGTQVATLADDTLSYDDTNLPPEREFTYTIVAVTGEEGDVEIGPVTAETLSIGARQTRLPSSGWLVEADHPSGRTVRPTLLESSNRSPSIRDLYRATAHVPMDDRWQDDSYEQVPARAWADGERLPVEQLDSVGRAESAGDARSTLELVGGVGLRTRVERDVDTQPVHGLVEELIAEHTDLVVNVDPPETTSTTEVLLDLSEAADWASALAETDLSAVPIDVDQETGELYNQQSNWVQEGWDDRSDDSGGAGPSTDPEYSGDGGDPGAGAAARLSSQGEAVEWTIAPEYDLPGGDLTAQIRENTDTSGDGNPEVTWTLDGQQLYVVPDTTQGFTDLGWGDRNDGFSGDLVEGEHTLRAEVTSGSSGWYDVDVISVGDGRYDYNYDNSVMEASDGTNYLDGPEKRPEIEVELGRVRTVLSVAGVEVESDWDDTSGGQAIAARNGAGDEWETAPNAEELDVTFDDLGALLDLRLTFGRHGTQEATPANGIEGQTIDSLTATADLDTTPLVIQRSLDDTILSIAQQQAKDANAVFGIGIDDGDLSFEWTQLGQRDGGEVVDVELLDEQTDYDHPERVIVYGGQQDVREETIDAERDEPVELENSRVDPNSEYIRGASGTAYAEGDDYEIGWNDGTITALPDGEISDGATLTIDYRYQPRAAQELDDVGGDPREEVVRIPELESERGCGLAAFRILQEIGEPLQSATVQLPEDAGVSVVESVSAEGLTADSYELRGIESPAVGTELTLGSRRQADAVVDDIRSQLRSLSGQL